MDENNSFSMRRIYLLFGMLLVFVISNIGLGIYKGFYWDQIAAMLLFSIIMMILIVLYLENKRIKYGADDLNAKDFKTVLVLLIGGMLLTIVAIVSPIYFSPMLLIALCFTAAIDLYFALISCVFYSAMIYIYAGISGAELLELLLLSVVGGILCITFEEKKNRPWGVLLVIAFSVSIPALICFMTVQSFQLRQTVVSLAGGIIIGGISVLVVPHLQKKHAQIKPDRLNTILSEHFSLLKTMKEYSKVEYEHAQKVAEISAACAKDLEADSQICRAAGFYYRLGKMEGEPHVENGVSLAETFDFPMEVIKILSEYNGEKNLPSTLESAIVHIVDCIVTKFEVLDDATFSNNWNKEMVIYQTMNEKSVEGLYDHSGLSMNAFLKIRELLMKEERLS